tara:strand:+ start:594 stop:857 length:264 start_codon:yes stop_codon:yes gene_type:complete
METVTEKKFIEKEELEKLNQIQTKTKQLVLELGEIEMVRISLDKRREQAETFLIDLTNEEKELTNSIFDKYGKVNLDPKSGELTQLD